MRGPKITLIFCSGRAASCRPLTLMLHSVCPSANLLQGLYQGTLFGVLTLLAPLSLSLSLPPSLSLWGWHTQPRARTHAHFPMDYSLPKTAFEIERTSKIPNAQFTHYFSYVYICEDIGCTHTWICTWHAQLNMHTVPRAHVWNASMKTITLDMLYNTVLRELDRMT